MGEYPDESVNRMQCDGGSATGMRPNKPIHKLASMLETGKLGAASLSGCRQASKRIDSLRLRSTTSLYEEQNIMLPSPGSIASSRYSVCRNPSLLYNERLVLIRSQPTPQGHIASLGLTCVTDRWRQVVLLSSTWRVRWIRGLTATCLGFKPECLGNASWEESSLPTKAFRRCCNTGWTMST